MKRRDVKPGGEHHYHKISDQKARRMLSLLDKKIESHLKEKFIERTM